MKAVKYLSIFFLIAYCCISCKEDVHETLQIAIQNRTDYNLYLTLYPKVLIDSGTYPICKGCDGGGYQRTEFVLRPNNDGIYSWNEVILVTMEDFKIEPYALASQAFDSIYIHSANEDHVIIKLTHEEVTGYSENIFSENSTWEFEVREWLAEMFISQQTREYIYTFLILKDKVIIE